MIQAIAACVDAILGLADANPKITMEPQSNKYLLVDIIPLGKLCLGLPGVQTMAYARSIALKSVSISVSTKSIVASSSVIPP